MQQVGEYVDKKLTMGPSNREKWQPPSKGHGKNGFMAVVLSGDSGMRRVPAMRTSSELVCL